MSASSTLSVELWQTILRYAISVVDFLDPDAFEGDLQAPGFGLGDPDARVKAVAYWDAERARNILRRVCRPWDDYLRRFHHRFVDMADVMHGKVDEISLKSATRISAAWKLCRCEICIPPLSTDGPIESSRRFDQFCWDTLLHFSHLPVQILELRYESKREMWNSGALRSLAQLQVITTSPFCGGGINYPLFYQVPSLKHICGPIYDELVDLRFTSHTVVTLAFRIVKEGTHETILMDLPSLRHFRISYSYRISPSTFFETMLMPFIGKVGNKLRSLYIENTDAKFMMPVEIWEKCPHLERFHPGMRLVPPPVSHPIHTVSVPPEHITSVMTMMQLLNLQSLISDGKWVKWKSNDLNDVLAVWESKMRGRGVTLEDVDGVILEEYLKGRG